jgi:hypothetical protein
MLMLRVIKKVVRIGNCLILNILLMFKMENFILSPFVAEISVYVFTKVYDLFEPYTLRYGGFRLRAEYTDNG